MLKKKGMCVRICSVKCEASHKNIVIVDFLMEGYDLQGILLVHKTSIFNSRIYLEKPF